MTRNINGKRVVYAITSNNYDALDWVLTSETPIKEAYEEASNNKDLINSDGSFDLVAVDAKDGFVLESMTLSIYEDLENFINYEYIVSDEYIASKTQEALDAIHNQIQGYITIVDAELFINPLIPFYESELGNRTTALVGLYNCSDILQRKLFHATYNHKTGHVTIRL